MRLHRLRFYGRVLHLLWRGRTVSAATIREDYDRLSETYDAYFTKHVAPHSRRMVSRLRLPQGARVLDLACGTGTLTLALAGAVGRNGSVTGIDASAGMIKAARLKRAAAGYDHVEFLQSDIGRVMDHFRDGYFDAVTCGWAIGYGRPCRLLAQIRRKLKPGGLIGIIENIRDTLAPIRKTAVKVAQTLPQYLDRVMDLHFRLPRGRAELGAWFERAGLRPLHIWEGREPFTFANGAEVLNWVLHTGASAGFNTMMAPGAKARCDELFVRYMDRDYKTNGHIELAHRYVAGVARKDA
ncbi:MAG: methyltransferase domain-containing protein [Kiritimatiellae bacterium]|nr:methyltransferase domain-containing protein [Kiritimatiellia bacterium]